MNVICVNPECPEVNVPKDNSGGFDVAEIRCGICGAPVEEVTE